MIGDRLITVILALSLLLIAVSGAIVAGEDEPEDEPEKISNGKYWSEEIIKPEKKDQGNWKYTISVDELNGKNFDVYILESAELGKYKDDKAFSAKVSMENITSTGRINFSIKWDDPDYYLVVDNKDNINAGDAYANETISVKIKLEKEEKEGLWFFICAGLVIIGIIALIVIIIWIRVERKRPQKPYKPFPPLENPPLPK